MSTNDPRDPREPRSPDRLEMRGRVAGVTRIGPRAIGLGVAVIGLLLIAVIYGVNKSSAVKSPNANASAPPVVNQASPQGNPFANVPLAPTPGPSTEPPPPLLPAPTPVPNVEANTHPADNANAAATSANNAAQEAEAQREAQAQAQRDAEEKARRERIAAAYRSPIFGSGSGEQAGSGAGGFVGSAGGAPVQLAASGSSTDTSGGFAGNGGVSGTPSLANGLMGRSGDSNGAQPTPNPNAFLAGPTGQYANAGSGAQNFSFESANPPLPANTNSDDYLASGRTGARSPYQITAGTVIPAALITGIDSELPGLMTAQVREDVYDTKTGKYLLIPRGTRLVGLYKSGLSNGQDRILVTWQRMIFPDTSNIDLMNMPGHDVGGFAGFGGDVDNHSGKIIGAVLLSSIITAAFELTNPQQSGANTNGGLNAGQTLSSAVGQNVAQATSQLIQRQIQIPPVVYVAKGYPFIVMVDRDIVFPGVYHGL